MGTDDWLLQDELEKYEAKIYMEKLLLNAYESAFSQRMKVQNSKVGNVKEEMKNELAKLEEFNNPNGMSFKTWLFLTNERCFNLGKQLNTLTCNRRKKHHKLRSAKKNLKTIQKELHNKQDNIQTNQKMVQELQTKLDGILSNQKQALLSNQKQMQLHEELQETKVKFPSLLKEMEKYLDTQTRDIEEFRMVIKEASDMAVPNRKEDSPEDLVRLLKESLDQNKLELLKEKRFCKYTLHQLQRNRSDFRKYCKELERRSPEGPTHSRMEKGQRTLTEIGKAAERMLGVIDLMDRPQEMGEIGHSRFEEFTKELVSISTLCCQTPPSESGAPYFLNSRPKPSGSTGWDHPIPSEGSGATSWVTVTSGSFPNDPPPTPVRSSISLPSLHKPFKWP